MRPRIKTTLRFCQEQSCGQPIIRRPKEPPAQYNVRVYCSRACSSRNVPRGPRPKRYFRNGSPLVARMAHDLYFIGRLKQTDIMRMFGVNQSSVSRYVNGQSWIHSA